MPASGTAVKGGVAVGVAGFRLSGIGTAGREAPPNGSCPETDGAETVPEPEGIVMGPNGLGAGAVLLVVGTPAEADAVGHSGRPGFGSVPPAEAAGPFEPSVLDGSANGSDGGRVGHGAGGAPGSAAGVIPPTPGFKPLTGAAESSLPGVEAMGTGSCPVAGRAPPGAAEGLHCRSGPAAAPGGPAHARLATTSNPGQPSSTTASDRIVWRMATFPLFRATCLTVFRLPPDNARGISRRDT
jgi:hypothetical protein